MARQENGCARNLVFHVSRWRQQGWSTISNASSFAVFATTPIPTKTKPGNRMPRPLQQHTPKNFSVSSPLTKLSTRHLHQLQNLRCMYYSLILFRLRKFNSDGCASTHKPPGTISVLSLLGSRMTIS